MVAWALFFSKWGLFLQLKVNPLLLKLSVYLLANMGNYSKFYVWQLVSDLGCFLYSSLSRALVAEGDVDIYSSIIVCQYGIHLI